MLSLCGRLLKYYWQHRDQFVRFGVIGTSATVLDIVSLYSLKEYAGLRPVLAVVINQVFAVIYVFSLNKFWTFRAKGLTHKQVLRFALLCGFNYIFALVWMLVGNDVFGLNYLFVRLANIILAAGWNFLAYKHWVYAPSLPVYKKPASP